MANLDNGPAYPADESPPAGSIMAAIRFSILIAVLIICLLGGGSARYDVASLLYLRPAIIICIALMLALPGPFHFSFLKVPLWLLAGWGAIMFVQLIPQPPGLWHALPGREHYLEAAQAAGMAEPWRPISLTPDLTWNSILALLVPLAVLLGFAAIRRNQSQALLYVVIGFACISAVLGLLQLGSGEQSPLFLYRVTHAGSAVGFFANRNHEAALLALAFPLLRVWTLLPHPDRHWRRLRDWIAIAIGLFLIPMILVTGSRQGLALALIGLFGAFLLAPPTPRPWESGRGKTLLGARLRWALLISLPVAISGLVLLFGRAVAIQRLMSIGERDEARLEEMPVMIRMLKEFFPLGTGFGSFDPTFRNFEPDSSLSPLYFNHAHNDLIEVALTGGLLAIVLLAAFVAWWLYRSFRVVRPYADYAPEILFARAGSIMILILFVASFVDYPLRTPLAAAVFAIAVAWLARAPDGSFRRPAADRTTAVK